MLILLANFFRTLHLRPRDDSVTREADEVVSVPAFAFAFALQVTATLPGPQRTAPPRSRSDVTRAVAQLGKQLCGPGVCLRVCCMLPNLYRSHAHNGPEPRSAGVQSSLHCKDVCAFAPALQQFMLCFHFDSVKKICNDAHLRVIE